MMHEIVFRPSHKACPQCGRKLLAHKRYRRTVRYSGGNFTALNETRRCPEHGIFRSDILQSLISRGCIYASDIMVDAAMKRFMDGRSCSEISSDLKNGISERHVRNLSNMALEIFSQIHEESVQKLKASMESYILQIDGTTDSEFSMIIVVRDALSDFVLYVKRFHSESEESIEKVLNEVKKKFGVPSGITSDMRSGILAASEKVFPGIPVRICLMHFLRDLGKDMMESLHTDLGIMIRHAGIKAPLKSILRSMPDYDQHTLDEIDQGFCSDRERMEIMSIRRILENIVHTGGSSGYGFPFSLRHYNFFTACQEAEKKLSDLAKKMREKQSVEFMSIIADQISRLTYREDAVETSRKLSEINALIFQKIRKAFRIPDHGRLSEENRYDAPRDDPVVHENCRIIFGEFGVYLNANIPDHLFKAVKHAIAQYECREYGLFAQNTDGTIPRTNNGMERFFRKIRRNVRKRCGNIATGNILAQSGESLALFQNMSNEKYRDIVFGSENVAAVFAGHRKQFRREGMSRKRKMELVDTGIEMIQKDTLSGDPYNERLWEETARV